MKYLAYFRPNERLHDLILKQDKIILPSMGLHSTVCFFQMEPEHESSLVADLSALEFHPFKIETQRFDDFDSGALVLRLSKSEELSRLHKGIVEAVGKYAAPDFQKIAEQYFGDNYHPHFTISESSSRFDRSSTVLLGVSDEIKGYHLAKKVEGKWKGIKAFYSVA